MKISCAQENIARGLATVKAAVSTKAVLPILNHVLLDAREEVGEGRIRIAATDLDLSISCYIPSQNEERGAVAVPARVFTELVNTLPQEPLVMQLNGETQTLHVQCGRMTANVKGVEAREFPEAPTPAKGSIEVELDAKGLHDVLDRVVLAAASEESRPVLAGILLKFDERRLTLAAADGYRLSIQHAGISTSVEPFSIIVPARAMDEVGRLCTSEAGSIALTVSPNKTQLRFKLATTEIVSQLIAGSYPDVTQIVPKAHTSRAVVNVAELLGAAKTVSAFVERNGKSNGIRLDADPANSRILVMGAHAERGDGLGDVDAAIEGPAFKVGLQVTYLVSLLERLKAPQLAIEFNHDGGRPMPLVVRAVGDDDFIHVMMPLVDDGPRTPTPPSAE